ncbi:hypothetical protein CC2G_011885 [Coprinopsis cinerea AmutBmut pab1-1]|nr:hypothetical protein CC2G_011885 [Coprinopsis cinerea AmutBmut pab1-1]
MDQDSFRSLLSSGASSSSRTPIGRSSSKPTVSKAKTIDASQPAFKPRKVKPNAESKYRDRATERRLGQAHDFAHVEAVLSEFEKQAKEGNSADIEEKRKYLGGDSEHSVLVKGLDFALLEQNKARAALATDAVDDDSLEQAFSEASKPKKRTREDLLRELKEKRTGGAGGEVTREKSAEEEARLLEEAKQKGKFKPIGFKPIGGSTEGKKKKKVKGEGKDRERKKKRKIESEAGPQAKEEAKEGEVVQPTTSSSTTPAPPPGPEPEPIDDDFDIFADAGEYKGLELDDDDDNDDDESPKREEGEEQETAPGKWVSVDDDLPIFTRKTSEPPPRTESPKRRTESPARETGPPKPVLPEDDLEDGEMDVDERPARLVPLASSTIDVKELLEMDRASTSWNKNRKKKDKKKKAAGGDDEEAPGKVSDAKVERDYQRLKAYTDKKKS